jgi:hypothetical protein
MIYYKSCVIVSLKNIKNKTLSNKQNHYHFRNYVSSWETEKNVDIILFAAETHSPAKIKAHRITIRLCLILFCKICIYCTVFRIQLVQDFAQYGSGNIL